MNSDEEQMVFQIDTIQFGILSDKDVLIKSVCEINKPSLCIEEGSVYDPRLGCVDNISTCETCDKNIWECTGHFGHINLNIPIIIFYKQVATMLKIFCHKCCKLLNTKEELAVQGVKGYERIVEHLSNMSFCGRCAEPHPEIRFDTSDNKITAQYKHKSEKISKFLDPVTIKHIFDNVCDDDVSTLGVDPEMFHPRNLVRMVFNVIPTCCRPRMVTPDNISDDDLSISLVDIIKKNNLLAKGGLSPEKYEETAADIKFRVLTYCDNSKGLAVHNTNHKPLTGLKERITRKEGHMRHHLMGKRCNLTARTVAGPDPTLKLNELAMPEEIANILTIPENVTDFNMEALTTLVNTPGKASNICKKNGNIISVPTALVKHGTVLRHGDSIERDGKTFTVTNCKIPLQKNDIITRQQKIIPTILNEKRFIKLEVGDRVDRFLRDGDYVLLNRQPTLHRNSMQGMKIKIRPGKTFRTNLAIAAGFNLDFDGDELNVFAHESLESRAELALISNAENNILSAQCNKSEMVIVQDSLLGAYKMTEKVQYMSRAKFMHCIFHVGHEYDFHERLETIRRARGEPNTYSTHALFGFLFPADFHIEYDNGLEIRNGVLLGKGFFEKNNLSKSPNSIIRRLNIEYSSQIASAFIDNIQFLTNAWLTMNPFSINIYDCLINNPEKRRVIKDTINKYFIEADSTSRTTDNPQIRESRVNCALNKAKDIGLKIAKESLRQDNNFISTVTSGSKGDYFNIAQMTGLLGQQNLDGQRPRLVLDNGNRTLVHYPRVILDSHRKYKSRGFVASSFIEGMKPDEMFFHAMTGRDGMIKTSMGTATSGYGQRSILKLNEDLKIEYDGTVRDAKKNIYQFMYGNHGFDPSKVDVHKQFATPVNFQRLANRLNTFAGSAPEFMNVDEIEEIAEQCTVQANIPDEIKKNIDNIQLTHIREELSKVKIAQDKFNVFKDIIAEKYNTLRITPGECVGIIGAQSIGERQTQTTLNTFHTAGKLQQSGIGRLEELLNMTKKLRVKTCTIFFLEKYETADQLRAAIGSTLTGLTFANIVQHHSTTTVISDTGYITNIEFDFDIRKMFENRINPFKVSEMVNEELCTAFDVECKIKPTGIVITFHDKDRVDPAEHLNTVNKIHICGMKGVKAFHLDHDGNEWVVVTEGSNLRKMLAHPLIDNKRLYCNDVWEVYECLGIAAARKMLTRDLKKVVCGVNLVHIQLLVDKMTFKGKPCSITRYTMRNNDVGPLSKATFEESTDILINAAMKTEIENNAGVSAAIISGRQPKAGTGFMALLMDYKKLLEIDPEPEPEPEPETYYY